MTLRAAALILLLALGWGSARADDPWMEDPRFLLMGQADQALEAGDYPAAVARLQEAIDIAPEAPDVPLLMSNQAMAHFAMCRDTTALSILDRALERTPNMTTLKSNRARVLLALGRDEEAFDIYSQLLPRDSLNREMRYNHGMIALYHGNDSTARADFRVLEALDPDGLPTVRALAALYSLTREDARAIPYFQQLIRQEPSAEYYAALAGCQLATGRLNDASETLGEAFGLFPADAELLYYRAWLRRDQYRLDDARADLRRAVALGLPPAKARALMPE